MENRRSKGLNNLPIDDKFPAHILESLAKRLPYEDLKTRLCLQGSYQGHAWKRKQHNHNILHSINLSKLERILSLTGLYSRGNDHFRAIETHQHSFTFQNLPASFHASKILHLSDLHFDLDPTLFTPLKRAIANLHYDYCVITGDFCDNRKNQPIRAIQLTQMLRDYIHSPIFAVLGNHDRIQILPYLEAMGINVLINESIALHKASESIYLGGVDDPHLYRTDDCERTSSNIPGDAFSILLSHSPATYQKALEHDFDLLLCGHTHGGQICMPSGKPFILNGKFLPFMLKGSWQYESLQAYTSAGCGACGIAVRFFCRPEITIHTLLSELPNSVANDRK